jgi:hypothetical protein
VSARGPGHAGGDEGPAASGARPRIVARFLGFGEVEVDGRRYDRDVVIEGGRVRRRDKGPSKRRGGHGHTPLTVAEAIPWGCRRLIIGSGAAGALPIDDAVREEARRRGVELVVAPTAEACETLSASDPNETAAILHLTC